jgi:hypothetical protein
MSGMGQKHCFDSRPVTSGLPPINRDSQSEPTCLKGAMKRLMHRRKTQLYSWLADPEIDWRSIPYRVEERVNWQRSASSLSP